MTTTERKTIKQFVRDNRITAKVEWADSNPNMEPSEHMTRHFRVKLCLGKYGHVLTVPFSQGSAHTDEPRAEDVLSCLASDAASVEQSSFEDGCSEYGYDTDSRKAERTYKACEKAAAKLTQFLGSDLYDELLYQTEGE